MITFFDTSTLVAAMSEDASHHAACALALETAEQGFTSGHCLAECYATLTGGRLGFHVSPVDAAHLIRNNVYRRLSVVTLSSAEYQKLVDAAGPAGARGGAIYDFSILHTARKIKAEQIFTLNRRHFITLAPDLEHLIVSP